MSQPTNVSAKFLQIDGAALDVAAVLASVMGTPLVTVEGQGGGGATIAAPAATTEAIEPAPPARSDAPREVPHGVPPMCDDDPVTDPVGAGSDAPVAPFESWLDIPGDRLMWNSTKMVAHVAITPNDPTRVYCPAKLVRVIGGDPVISNPDVCKSCNRQIGIAARKVRG